MAASMYDLATYGCIDRCTYAGSVVNAFMDRAGLVLSPIRECDNA
jgi:hypothetical protein